NIVHLFLLEVLCDERQNTDCECRCKRCRNHDELMRRQVQHPEPAVVVLLRYTCHCKTVVMCQLIDENHHRYTDSYYYKWYSVADDFTVHFLVGKIVIRFVRFNKFLNMRLSRSEEHTSELQSRFDLVCLLLSTLCPYTTLFRSWYCSGTPAIARPLLCVS